jgi:hypothetical protein
MIPSMMPAQNLGQKVYYLWAGANDGVYPMAGSVS